MNHAAANIYGQVQGLMCSGLGTDTQECWLKFTFALLRNYQ